MLLGRNDACPCMTWDKKYIDEDGIEQIRPAKYKECCLPFRIKTKLPEYRSARIEQDERGLAYIKGVRAKEAHA